jgi:hypothetical protein
VSVKRLAILLLAAALLTPCIGQVTGPSGYCAYAAEESWKAEFDSVCGQTENAADMSVPELKKAIERCDALKPQIETLEATPRKIYLKRLQMCRSLYLFLLEGKEKK